MPLTNSEIKFVRSLHQKKNRSENGLFLVEGEKMVKELIHQKKYSISEIFGTESLEGYEVQIVSKKELERMSTLKSPNKFLAIVSSDIKEATTNSNQLLMIDLVNDPGNMGTIIRTADWFGIKDIILDKNSVEVFNPKVVQSTMGAIFRVNIRYANLVQETKKLQSEGYKFYGAFMEGEDYKSVTFDEKSVLVMGSESHGISSALEEVIDYKITIPSQGDSESLNLAVATGIILAEFKA